MDRSCLTRGIRWCQAHFPSLSSLELIHEKNIIPKNDILSLVTSGTYSIRLTANLRAQIASGEPGPSLGYLTILLAITVIEMIANFCENSRILRKFDLFDPCDLKFDLIKKLPEHFFVELAGGLSNFLLLVAPFLSFRVIWGVGIRPPPPAVRRWLRPPAVRGIIT